MKISDKYATSHYQPAPDRYHDMTYRRCGRSGIQLPALSLGLWHNFGETDDLTVARDMLRSAFDQGITHFDLANNYGPPYGAAEENFGHLLRKDFAPFRDELIISTKAGWDMWPGPYGNLGSRKYLIASLDQSLRRMGLEYVDIFYSHRPDPDTPFEETMGALDHIVRQGKALYIGISQYNAGQTQDCLKILKELGTPLFIHQPRYNMFDRWVENGLLDVLGSSGTGAIVFSPLSQGVLTDKYLGGFPGDSRAVRDPRYLRKGLITDDVLARVTALNSVARERNQTLAQMAISWLLRDERITSVLIGASKVSQLTENVKALDNLTFEPGELDQIEQILQ